MRIRKRNNLKKKNSAIVILFLTPLIGFLGVGSVAIYIIYDINSFTYELKPPDTDQFYELDDINMTLLEEMALIYDFRNMNLHSPSGFPVDITFKNRSYTFNAIDYWHHTDNGGAHSSYALAAACYKYKTALIMGDEELLINATREVKYFVKAYAKLIAAPNGGLGINPDTGEYYPGIIARFACSYQDAKQYHPFMLEDHVRHHNGTGIYKNWRIRLKTSRDEVCGLYLGWASVLKFIDPEVNEDSKWCVEQVRTMVDQVLHHWMKESNWLVLDYDGAPTGSDINTPPWKLIALRIGATAFPEKYESLYKYVASKSLQLNGATMGGLSNVGMEYFALLGAVKSMFPLILLEDNSDLRYHYIKNFEKNFYKMVRYHRNAFFNIVHLILIEMLDKDQRAYLENEEYDMDCVRWDVLDQLWRFHASNWCPIRNYNLTERPHSTRSTSLNPDLRKKVVDPTREKWLDFFENHPMGWMYAWMEDIFKMDTQIYELPSTISEHWAHHMIWQSNPFQKEGGDPEGDGLTESPGTSFTMVYWLGRAFEIF